MNNLTDFLLYALPIIFSFLIVFFEIRQSRKKDVYHETFNLLLTSKYEVESIINNINYALLSFYETHRRIACTESSQVTLERPLEDNISILGHYVQMHDYLNSQLNSLELLMDKIKFQSFHFRTESKSRNLLIGFRQNVLQYIDENYSELLSSLSAIKRDSSVFSNKVHDIFKTHIETINGVDQEVILFYLLDFKIDNFDEIILHFNKNNFK